MRRGAGGRNLALHVRENTTLWGEGIRLFQNGEGEAALECFTQMDYITATVCFNIATVHLALGNYESAIEMYTETLRRDMHFALAYFQRALAFHHYGWNEDALRDLQECHQRLRGNRFIDYHNLGLSHVFWECQVLANIAIVYTVLGLKRHAIQHVETALQSRDDSRHARQQNDSKALLKAALPQSFVMDIFNHCDEKENHIGHSCAMLPLQPHPLFKARGLSSLWLHASQRIKKDFLGKAKVVFCRGSRREPGFEGAQARASGRPLPVKEDKPGFAAAIKHVVTRGKNNDAAPRAQRTKSDLGPCAVQRAEAQQALQQHNLYKKRSKTTPAESISALRTVQDGNLEKTPEQSEGAIEPSGQSKPPRPNPNRVPTPLVFAHPFCLQVNEKHRGQSSNQLANNGVKPFSPPVRPPPLPKPFTAAKQEDDDLVIPRLLGAASDQSDSEEDSCDSGMIVDDAEMFSGTEVVALISLQLLSEELKTAESSPRTLALLKAISALTEQLQDSNDTAGYINPTPVFSGGKVPPARPARTHGLASNAPPKKPPRPPRRFNPDQLLPSPPAENIMDKISRWQCIADDSSDTGESTIGRKHSVDSGVQDIDENTHAQAFILRSLPKSGSNAPPARPKPPPSLQNAPGRQTKQKEAHREELEGILSRMVTAGNPYKTAGTAGPMIPKRPPPPMKGFAQKLTSAKEKSDCNRAQKIAWRPMADSEESDTDSSSSGGSVSREARCARYPIARPRAASSSSNHRQWLHNSPLTSVSSFGKSDREAESLTRTWPSGFELDGTEDEYELIVFEEKATPLLRPVPSVRTKPPRPKFTPTQWRPCQLQATNILSQDQATRTMPVQYV